MKKCFFRIFKFFIFLYLFWPKNLKNGLILAQNVAPIKNDQYLYTSQYNINCVRLLGLLKWSKMDHFTPKNIIKTMNTSRAKWKYVGWLLQKSCFFNTIELAFIFFMSDVWGCHRIILNKGKWYTYRYSVIFSTF